MFRNGNNLLFIFIVISSFYVGSVYGGEIITGELEPGVRVICRASYRIFIEFQAHRNRLDKETLKRFLADSREIDRYSSVRSAGVPLQKIKKSWYPIVFQSIFYKDEKDEEGWWHTVPDGFSLGREELGVLCMGLCGNEQGVEAIIKHPRNRGLNLPLKSGQHFFFPRDMLCKELQELCKKSSKKLEINPLEPMDEQLKSDQPAECIWKNKGNGLEYAKDAQGEHAVYVIQPGETLYRIIVRFTDYQSHEDILEACRILMTRNGIRDERNVEQYMRIKIPLELLSDRYLPAGSEKRKVYEQVKRESEKISKTRRIRKQEKTNKTLQGVVVVIDPGHGGRDHGAPVEKKQVYEDEVNYDISCRLKMYLEKRTGARVYITLMDISDGFIPVNRKKFVHDTDEKILVTPNHIPQTMPVSSNLRCLLANRLMKEAEKQGIPRENMIFITIHCDSIFKAEMRGLMVYIPGANYRSCIEKINTKTDEISYTQLKEWKYHNPRTLELSERIRDEAISRGFAEELLQVAQKNGIEIQREGPAIRNVIRRSKNSEYLPAVLRNVEIPAKVLVECVNLRNSKDLVNVCNPAWRQKMAETIAESVINYYGK